jgi:N12 class adenine-specific DNA methylase
MAAAAMELRRLGLASKILIVVPNDILQQFAEEFQHFYPLARLLVPGKDDFTPARRNEFMARIATGDWDAVIVAQSQFTLLPVNPETEAEFIERELAGYREALSEMADQRGPAAIAQRGRLKNPFKRPSSGSPLGCWAAKDAWRTASA